MGILIERAFGGEKGKLKWFVAKFDSDTSVPRTEHEQKYQDSMQSVIDTVEEVKDKSEEFFTGNFSDPLLKDLASRYRSHSSPPRNRYGVWLGDIETPKPQKTMEHMVDAVGKCMGLDEQGLEEAKRVMKKDLRDKWRVASTVRIADWDLVMQIGDFRSGPYVEARINPVEKPEHVSRYIDQQKEKLRPKLEPEWMLEKIKEGSKSAFALPQVEVAAPDSFEFGGPSGIEKLIEEAKWVPIIADEERSSYRLEKYYRREEGDPASTPRLRLLHWTYSPQNAETQILAVRTPEIDRKIKEAFYHRFREAAKDVVAKKLSGDSGEDNVDLNAWELVRHTMDQLEQGRLDDRSSAFWRLSEIAVEELLDQMSGIPALAKMARYYQRMYEVRDKINERNKEVFPSASTSSNPKDFCLKIQNRALR